ncbi:MAG: RNA polymerase sigma factor [Bradymonadia bacterium]
MSKAGLDVAMARLQCGDRAAFDEVFALAWPVVQAWCRASLGHHADGEDAAQIALEKIFAQASRYDPERSAMTWVLTIASYEVRTIRKARQRASARLVDATSSEVEEAADPQADPEAHVMWAELEQRAADVLDGLPASDQHLIRAALEGQPPREAGVSPATTRKRRQRAFERLRHAWRMLNGQ